MPLSWLAAGAPGRMPAVRRPEMHHSSLCAEAYLKGHRDANGWRKAKVWGQVELLRGEKARKQWSIRTLRFVHRGSINSRHVLLVMIEIC
jgi:hypothetical protein